MVVGMLLCFASASKADSGHGYLECVVEEASNSILVVSSVSLYDYEFDADVLNLDHPNPRLDAWLLAHPKEAAESEKMAASIMDDIYSDDGKELSPEEEREGLFSDADAEQMAIDIFNEVMSMDLDTLVAEQESKRKAWEEEEETQMAVFDVLVYDSWGTAYSEAVKAQLGLECIEWDIMALGPYESSEKAATEREIRSNNWLEENKAASVGTLAIQHVAFTPEDAASAPEPEKKASE